MLKYIAILYLLVLHCYFLSAQESVRKFVQQSSVPISTIEPDSINFSDLESIGSAIKDARIVMLGEQDHGDAPTFLAKTRLIKYLHQKNGFDVLAFEGDFFGLNDGWDNVGKTKPEIESFFLKNIYPIWTGCHTCKNLFFQYLPGTLTTPQPIIITGFDNQMMTDRSYTHLRTGLDSCMKKLNLGITKQPDYSTLVLPTLDSLRGLAQKSKTDAFFDRCSRYLAIIKQQAQDKGLSKDDFWMVIIDNLIAEKEEERLAIQDSRLSETARDAQMAKNLQWLANVKYPGKKIIVWAANAHIARFPLYKEGDNPLLIRMGRFFTSDTALARKTFTIGFTSFEGEAGRLGWPVYKVQKPVAKSFENWIDPSWNYSFTDFSQLANRSQRFYLKGLGHNSRFEYEWANVFDGIFYIRTMYACKANPDVLPPAQRKLPGNGD